MFAKCPAGSPGTGDEAAGAAEPLLTDRGAIAMGSALLMNSSGASYCYGPPGPEAQT